MKPRAAWERSLAVVPSVAIGSLPACPMCWPAYAGLVSSVGLGVVLNTKFLLPLTALSLLVALAGLGYRAQARRGYGPLVAGAVAASLLLVGKFSFDSDPAIYLGVVGLIAAALWNAWPQSGSDEQGTNHGCFEAGRGRTRRPNRKKET